MVYICKYIFYICHTFIPRREHGGFYGLDLKKGNDGHGNLAMNILDLSIMKEMAADSKAKVKNNNTGSTFYLSFFFLG